MKEAYSKPVVDVKEFKAQDVLTVSNTNMGPEISDGEDDD